MKVDKISTKINSRAFLNIMLIELPTNKHITIGLLLLSIISETVFTIFINTFISISFILLIPHFILLFCKYLSSTSYSIKRTN
jgi:hypothetical protein